MSECNESSDIRTGYIQGRTFSNKKVEYAVVDGEAIFEGDIILGTAEEMAATIDDDGQPVAALLEKDVVISGSAFRWPKRAGVPTMPYTIASTLPNQQRVTDAIAVWERNSPVRFVRRGQERDYVTFRPAGGCGSWVGRQGGQQFINLASGCSTGNTIHEIGHALGLWHAQSREDRETYVTINWSNIQDDKRGNFNQHISDGTDILSYNYRSMMHYGTNFFTKNGLPTIVPRGGQSIGQRKYLTDTEIAAVATMYGGSTALLPPLAAASWGRNRLDVFGLQADGSVFQLWWNGRWHRSNLGKPPLSAGGGRFRSALTAASWGNNRHDVFGVGANGNIVQLWWNGSWHWSDLGKPPSSVGDGALRGSLTAASWGDNRYDVFGLGGNGNIVQRWWDGRWHWSDLG